MMFLRSYNDAELAHWFTLPVWYQTAVNAHHLKELTPEPED